MPNPSGGTGFLKQPRRPFGIGVVVANQFDGDVDLEREIRVSQTAPMPPSPRILVRRYLLAITSSAKYGIVFATSLGAAGSSSKPPSRVSSR